MILAVANGPLMGMLAGVVGKTSGMKIQGTILGNLKNIIAKNDG